MGLMKGYIRIVDGFNRRIGRIVMYGIFVMMGILLWSSFSKVGSDLGFDINPSLWTLEMAQFAMVAYYILGGPYSIQLGSNVRMDLIYGELSNRRKAWVDSFSVLFLIFYLGILLWGGIESTEYSFKYGGEASLRVDGTKMQLTSIPDSEWSTVEAAARVFWDEIASESETKAKVVDIIKKYNADMDKAGRPYRYS